MRIARCLLLVLLLAASSGCQNSLRALAKGATGQLDPPNIAARTPPSQTSPQTATPDDSESDNTPSTDPSLDNFRAGLEQYAQRQQDLFSAPPEPTSQQSPVSQTSASQSVAASPASREQAFQQVLDDLQELGKESPAAQQRLLAQLRTSDPSYWEALAHRAKSELKYHQELVATSTPTANQRVAALPESPTSGEAPRATPSKPSAQPTQPNQPPNLHPPTHEALQHAAPHSAAQQQHIDPAVQTASATMRFGATDSAVAMPMPGQPGGDLSWDAALDRAIEGLSTELSTHPQTTAEAYHHVRLRLLQLAAGNLNDAAQAAPGLTATEQQYWSNQLLAISTLLDHHTQTDARRRAAAGGVHLKRAIDELDELGSLTVSNVVFCQEIYGFGAYKPVEKTHFKPGQEVKLYAEIDNYKSLPTPQGVHTSLATSYKVLDQHGGLVDSGEVPVVNDYCAQRRRDFHIEYTLTLPQRVYPGAYVLELTLTDQLGDKIGHGSIQFDIAAE